MSEICDVRLKAGSDFFLVGDDIQDLKDLRRNSGFSPLPPGPVLAGPPRRFDFREGAGP